MATNVISRESATPSVSSDASARHIISFTALSFVVYLAIGLPLEPLLFGKILRDCIGAGLVTTSQALAI